MYLEVISFFLLKLIYFLSFKFRFCRDCLSSCESASGPSTCPVCRTSFNARQKFNARDIEQQIYQSRGYCSGCNRRVTLCYAPINVNLDGAWKARQRTGIWTRSNFWRQMPYPGAIILGQKRTNSLPLQLKLEAKSVSVKRRLRTADCRLRTRGKMQTACKMQTADSE